MYPLKGDDLICIVLLSHLDILNIFYFFNINFALYFYN